jgi:CheY-like chemotaxis protein
MQLLIVHDDAEVGEQLMNMLQDYTPHQCALVESEAAALRWASEHARCGLLLAQLEGPAVDGLALGGALSEIFPGLQTLFFPAYPASEQRLEIANTKVFPEPIDGERLLAAVETAAAGGPDAPDLFHTLDVLQMCCLGGQSGAVQIVKGASSGVVYLRDGKIVHAESATARGTEALFKTVSWDLVEFAYDGSVRAPETISMPWDEALLEAAIHQKEDKSPKDGAPASKSPEASDFAPPPKKRGFFGALRRG